MPHEQYKHLRFCLIEMAADNSLPQDHYFKSLEPTAGYDLETLERQAKSLTFREKIMLTCGERYEAQELATYKGIEQLDAFLSEVFTKYEG